MEVSKTSGKPSTGFARAIYGLACPKGSENALQAICSEFDSHRVHHASIAQLAERPVYIGEVVGSLPTRSTIF